MSIRASDVRIEIRYVRGKMRRKQIGLQLQTEVFAPMACKMGKKKGTNEKRHPDAFKAGRSVDCPAFI